MEGVYLSYEAAETGIGNYLSAVIKGEINNYQMKMMEHNKIPGLLTARGAMINGMYRINYKIDGMRRLSAVLAGGLSGQEAKRFMKGLLQTLSGLEEYFLSYMQCFLDIDYIYLDSSGRAELVYLPLAGQIVANEEAVRQFCQKLFAEYFTADGDTFFLKLLRYVNMQDFSLAGLVAWFEDEDENAASAEAGAYVVPNGSLVSQNAKNSQMAQGFYGGQGFSDLQGLSVAGKNNTIGKEQKPTGENRNLVQENNTSSSSKGKFGLFHKEATKKESEGEDAPGFAIPGAGFAVPKSVSEKGEVKQEKQDKKTQKEKPQKEKEKGGSLFKSLLGGKKEKTSEEKTMPIPAAGISLPGNNVPRSENHVNPKNNSDPLPENPSGGWHGTVMMGENHASGTVMMGVEAAPYLLYQGQKISLEHFPFTIGKENTDFIIGKNVVSRMHASINCREDGYFVMDENSKNHTWLNGKQLSPYTETPLRDGDTLRLANEIMTFHI